METRSGVLSFESVDEILWCDHSNETSKAVLLHGNICFSIFYKKNLEFFLNFDLKINNIISENQPHREVNAGYFNLET